ncbi:MAG: hypothetical protein A3D28_02700 [Omnitrophica bacterium RIFCSPHIGHO2_02_FULL_63_14]|nr:MAG: hypothetical protein A3D28_02700 [Omnitrophica bacterium RIFCSPHIGHO2_02_FULL_63_14]
MADEAVKAAGRPPKKKKSRPTNCAQSNKRIRRKNWYYRNGRYFANKKSFQLFAKQKEEEKAKKASEAAPAPTPAPAEG